MFKLQSKYKPSGNHPEAIEKLLNRPTLVIAHNKTLAGQLYSELKELFPENRVNLFISYYRNTQKNILFQRFQVYLIPREYHKKTK